MKIKLFVEGQTERAALQEYLKRWLDPRLPSRIGVQVVAFEGWRDYYDEIAVKVDLHLSGKQGRDVVGAIGLLDLYGPNIYPAGCDGVEARYAWFKADLEKRVAHSRFRQHFAVHETEAWLLADPSILPRAVADGLPGKAKLPETVNFNEPPAKLLDRLYRERERRSYKKVTDGRNLFLKASPEVAYQRCPYFKRLLDDMLDLASKGAA